MREYPEIVGIGHNCLDYLCTVEEYPPEDSSTHITAIENQGGGAAATAMAAAARLGHKCAMIGYLGDDETGDAIVKMLKADGVLTDHIARIEGKRSSVSYVMVNPASGSRTKFPYPDELPMIEWDERLTDVLSHAKVLHLDSTKIGNSLPAARLAKKLGVMVSLDACSVKGDIEENRELAGLADVLIMNAKYPHKITGIEDYEEAVLKVASWCSGIVIGTQGKDGCVAVIDGKLQHFPAFSVKAIDTTGAGDVFHGAFVSGLLRGMSLNENIRYASAVSALKCLKVGGREGIPTYEETMEFLSHN